MGEFKTTLSKVSDSYMGMLTKQLEDSKVDFDDYSKRCAINAIGGINNALEASGVDWNSPDLDRSTIGQILLNVATLQLNAAAEPAECFFQVRNVKTKGGDWVKKVELGVQGAGYESIAARFGRGIKRIMQPWEVRSYDDFKYPRFTGLSFEPPEWMPTGQGEVVRIVYPVINDDDTVNYLISERADVVKNLLAHISNNLMNETFGLAANRYKATKEQLEKIDAKKRQLKDKAKELGLEALDDAELEPYISPAWREPYSRESMIIRKMKNNAMKKVSKDFKSALAQSSYMEATNEEYSQAKNDIIDHEVITVEPIADSAELTQIEQAAQSDTDSQERNIQDGKSQNTAYGVDMQAELFAE